MELDVMWCSDCKAQKMSFFYTGEERCNYCGSSKTFTLIKRRVPNIQINNLNRKEHPSEKLNKRMKALYLEAKKHETVKEFLEEN